MQCCCGRIKGCLEPVRINNTIHEPYGKMGNFCGPADKHKIRDLQHCLGELLAVIFRDGGQRYHQLGTAQNGVDEACKVVVDLRSEAERLADKVKALEYRLTQEGLGLPIETPPAASSARQAECAVCGCEIREQGFPKDRCAGCGAAWEGSVKPQKEL